MCNTDNHIVLTESDNTQISWCRGCKTYSMLFKCCCVSFTQQEIESFQRVLNNLHERDFTYFFLGEEHALIQNHCSNTGLCLTRNDAENLKELIHEALTVNEAFSIIYNLGCK